MRKLFYLLCPLFLAVMFTSSALAEETRIVLRTPDEGVKAGETFTVQVDLEGNPGFCCFQFYLLFAEDEMECVHIDSGPLIEEEDRSVFFVSNPEAPGGGAALGAVTLDAVEGDGTAAEFTFRAKKNLQSFHFRMERLTLLDDQDQPVSTVISGLDRDLSAGTGSGGRADTGNTGGTGSGSGGGRSDSDTGSGSGGGRSGSDTGSESGGGRSGSDTGSESGGGRSGSDTGSESGGGRSGSDTGSESGGGRSDSNTGSGSGGGRSSGSSESVNEPPLSAEPDPVFSDIAANWAREQIQEGARRGLFGGYSDGTFRPDNRLTRAQFVTMLWNCSGQPEPETEAPFKDVSGEIETFQKAIAWASEQGFVDGTTPETFYPGGILTRQAAMKILFRFHGGQSGTEAMFTEEYDRAFTDSAAISPWGRAGMYWGVYHGIIKGTSAETLNPLGSITRAQCAAIMVRYTDKFPTAEKTEKEDRE